MGGEVFAPLLRVSELRDGRWRATVARFARAPSGQRNPAAVEFDYREVYRLEDRTGRVVGMFHTHPAGMPEMSATDRRAMRGWVKALGKPLLCVIESGGSAAAWEFDRKRARPRRALGAFVVSGRFVVTVFGHVRP